MYKTIHMKLEPEIHACLKEIAAQKGTTMTNLIREYVLDCTLKDSSGKITDGESWIHEYKERKRRKLW